MPCWGYLHAQTEQEQRVAHHAGKEYAKADSRYVRRESCVLGIEGLTAAVLGPLSFVVMYGIAARKPWRHTLAMLVSMGQLWGDLLYFLSAHLEGGACTAALALSVTCSPSMKLGKAVLGLAECGGPDCGRVVGWLQECRCPGRSLCTSGSTLCS